MSRSCHTLFLSKIEIDYREVHVPGLYDDGISLLLTNSMIPETNQIRVKFIPNTEMVMKLMCKKVIELYLMRFSCISEFLNLQYAKLMPIQK